MPDATSRYFRLTELTYTSPEGEQFLYKCRRIPPEGSSLPLQAVESVHPAGDRLDLLTQRTLGNPLLFWRIADANDAMNPFDLTRRNQLNIPAIRA